MSNPHCHRWGERTLRISAWIKGREEVKVLLLYTSLYYKLLWLLTMEFLSTQQHGLTSHYLICHEGCYCFLSQRGDAYIHTMFMPVFKNFGQTAQFQLNLVVILRFHGCISLRMEASRENSCRRICLGELQVLLTPNHCSAPKQNSMGSKFQCAVRLELEDHGKKSVPEAEVWPLNFPEYLI